MSKRTVEFAVGRNPEMGVHGSVVDSPILPFDIPEPDLDTENMLINIGPQHPATHGVDPETIRFLIRAGGWQKAYPVGVGAGGARQGISQHQGGQRFSQL